MSNINVRVYIDKVEEKGAIATDEIEYTRGDFIPGKYQKFFFSGEYNIRLQAVVSEISQDKLRCVSTLEL